MSKELKHPIQPTEEDPHGVIRFKKNAIVEYLAQGKLNDLVVMPFSEEDRQQLAQLIGYSVSGYGTLSYVTDAAWDRVVNDEGLLESQAQEIESLRISHDSATMLVHWARSTISVFILCP